MAEPATGIAHGGAGWRPGINPVVTRLIVRRIGLSVVLLLGVSVVVFAGTEFLPGDVAQMVLGQGATPAALAGLRETLHLDQPAWLRYLHWLLGLVSGNPGSRWSTACRSPSWSAAGCRTRCCSRCSRRS